MEYLEFEKPIEELIIKLKKAKDNSKPSKKKKKENKKTKND